MTVTRIRSPNYPAFGLPEAVEKIEAVYRELHNHSGPREVVAKALKYSGLNGASATAISALHKYGLLEKVGDGVKVSDRAMQILHPQSTTERAEAVRQAAAEPTLFTELAARFPGHRPSEELLRNYLLRNNFSPAAVGSVISAYRETSDMVERESVMETVASPKPKVDEMPPLQAGLTASIQPAYLGRPTFQPDITSAERPIGRYDFEGGAYVRIAVSGDLTTDEALDMVETIVKLKRAELGRAANRANARSGVTAAESEKGSDTDPFAP